MQKQQFILNRNVIYQGVREPAIELKQGTSLTVRQINSVFHMGMWRIESENELIFQPITSLFQRLFPLTVSCTELGTVYKFRAEQILNLERVFFDGIIQIEDGSLILDGIYSLSTPSEPLQIARIVQKLDPTSVSVNEFDRYGEQAKSSSVEADGNLATTNAKLVQLEIDPIQVIKNYSVILKGSTESHTFNSLEAILYVTFPSEGERPSHIQLTTKKILESQHGNFHWMAQPLVQCSERDWYFVTQAEADSSPIINIDLDYRQSIPTTNCIWHSKAENDLEADIRRAMGERITVNLTINGDRIKGNISALGQYIDTQIYSTYQATIVGEIEKSRKVEELRQTLDSENANFTECWITQISTIGKIKLQQHGNEAQGTYHPDNEYSEGQIRGIVEGNFVELNWTDGKQEGWGYFRSLNQGGTLAGMWGVGGFPNEPQAVVANWQLTIDLEAASQEDEIFLRELRWLGHELIIQQRFEQGVTVLDEILKLYRQQRHQLNISPQEEFSYLQIEAFTLVGYVLRCNIYSGKYHQLLGNLNHLIELIQLLGASESASRLFKEHTASIRQSLISFREKCQIFVEGFQRNKKLFPTQSEQEHSRVDLSNSLVEFTNPFNYLQVYVSQSIAIAETESNNLEQLNFGIIEENTDFVEAWAILCNYLAVFKEKINLNIEAILELKETIFVEHPVFLEDVNLAISIMRQLSNSHSKSQEFGDCNRIDSERVLNDRVAWKFKEQIDEKKSNSLEPLKSLDWQKIIEIFDELEELEVENLSLTESNNINLIELERKIDNFLSDRTNLSPSQSGLFRCYLDCFKLLNDFFLEVNLRHDFMLKIDIVRNYEENQQTSQTMLSNLTRYIERWRGKLVEDLEKIDALEQAQPLFVKVLEMSVALGDPQKALIFSEKSRARAFADLLATRFKNDADRELVDTPVISPEINFEQIKQIAKTYSATVVEYFVVRQEKSEVKIYIWVIQPNGNTVLETVELNSSSQQPSDFLSNLIDRARASFGVRDSNSNTLDVSYSNDTAPKSIDPLARLENSQTLLAELYQLLIKPIESYLKSSFTSKVILIPHEKLFELPFASLFNPETKEYLIERYSIILSPAIQALNLTQQNFTSKSDVQNVLVVGNPKMPSSRESLEPLARLPYAETAAKAISNIFKTKPLLGDRATKHEVLTQLSSARIIHFGTHGKFNRTQPLKGGIALASEGEEWGFLTVEEILEKFAPPQTASLNAELIVLSACSTGRGQITGDGVIGLARGLMAAGVKAVLVSLWEVRDFPTACLMVQFYKYLLSESIPNEALKKAQVWLKNITNKELKIWIRKQKLSLNTKQKVEVQNWLPKQQDNLYPFQHPYYWGAFYLIGA